MQLFVRKTGAGQPLVIMHGLYGYSDNWLHIAKALSNHFAVYSVDLRNHGHSPHHDVHTYAAMAQDIMELLEAEHLQQPVLLGHSMGGKVAMCLASRYPETFRSIIVADIAPASYTTVSGTAPHTLLHRRMMEAMMSLPLRQLQRREDADRLLADAVPERRTRLFLLKNLYLDQDGGFSWRLNLPVLARALPHILDGTDDFGPLPNAALRCPMLFLKGDQSDYISAATAPLIHRDFPQAVLRTVEGAGHWLHFEQPGRFVEAVLTFLLHE